MSDQKELKKRLKVLMNRPENQVCSDCPERQPRWASLIVPPPGAPEGSLPIGAFCCLECSGSHRRLGVHISFVRSINLDSWKEREVMSMENGGNAKVNAIFEAHLNIQKPSNHADGPTRERFIRDKYERRKYYDAAAFRNLPQPQSQQPPPQQQQQQQRPPPQRAHSQDEIGWSGSATSSVGPPSDAARQRVEERNRQQRGIRKSSSLSSDDSSSGGGREGRRGSAGGGAQGGRRPARPGGTRRPKVAQAPASAPSPQMDLLDFSSDQPATSGPSSSSSSSKKGTRSKSKESSSNNGSGGDGGGTDLFADFLAARNESWSPTAPGTAGAAATPGAQNSRAATKNSATVSQDILSLYGAPNPQANGNMGGMNHNNNMAGMTNMMQQMNVNQPMQNMNPHNMNPAQMQMMMQMQQQQMMMNMQHMHSSMPNLNYGVGAGAGGAMNFASFSPTQTNNNFAATFSNGFGADGFGSMAAANGPPLSASTFGHGFGSAAPGSGGGGGGRSGGGGGAATNRRMQHQNSAPTAATVNDDPFASLGNTRSHR